MTNDGAMLTIRDLDRPPGVRVTRGTLIDNAFPWHTHASYGLGRVEAGVRRMVRPAGVVEIPAGALFVIHPGEAHRCEGDGGGHSYAVVTIPEAVLAPIAADALGRDAGAPVFPRAPIADGTLSAALDAFLAAVDGDDPLAREVSFANLAGLLALRHAAGGAARARPAPRFAVRRVEAHIDAHLDADLTLATLSAVARLSPFHFQRVFHQARNLPVHAHVLQRRIRRAMDLVLAGEPLAEVAAACGFADQSHLTRVFRRAVGVTPARFRKGAGAMKRDEEGTV